MRDEPVGRSINNYLNHYVLVADGKAAAVAAASLALIGFTTAPDSTCGGSTIKLIGVCMAAAAAIAAGAVLFPRTPHSGNGHIFWADIRSFESATAYWKSLTSLDDEAIELEYARQNFLVSGVLLRKNAYVQRAIWMFCLAFLFLTIAYGVR